MDANFGLCRRKAAGKSVHPPLSGTEFFFEQSEVDSYVAHYHSQVNSSAKVREYVHAAVYMITIWKCNSVVKLKLFKQLAYNAYACSQ